MGQNDFVADTKCLEIMRAREDLSILRRTSPCVLCISKTRCDETGDGNHDPCFWYRKKCCLQFEFAHETGCADVIPKNSEDHKVCSVCGVPEMYGLHTKDEVSIPEKCPWLIFKSICFAIWTSPPRRRILASRNPEIETSCLKDFYRSIINGTRRNGSRVLCRVLRQITLSAKGDSSLLDYDACSKCLNEVAPRAGKTYFDNHGLCVECLKEHGAPRGKVVNGHTVYL